MKQKILAMNTPDLIKAKMKENAKEQRKVCFILYIFGIPNNHYIMDFNLQTEFLNDWEKRDSQQQLLSELFPPAASEVEESGQNSDITGILFDINVMCHFKSFMNLTEKHQSCQDCDLKDGTVAEMEAIISLREAEIVDLKSKLSSMTSNCEDAKKEKVLLLEEITSLKNELEVTNAVSDHFDEDETVDNNGRLFF